MKYGLLSKQERNNMAVEKKEVALKFYVRWCLSVITWYKKHLLKQVLPTTYTLDKIFAAAAFENFWVDPFPAD